jgi:hypothetical protein
VKERIEEVKSVTIPVGGAVRVNLVGIVVWVVNSRHLEQRRRPEDDGWEGTLPRDSSLFLRLGRRNCILKIQNQDTHH